MWSKCYPNFTDTDRMKFKFYTCWSHVARQTNVEHHWPLLDETKKKKTKKKKKNKKKKKKKKTKKQKTNSSDEQVQTKDIGFDSVEPLRKHAYLNILKIFPPKNENFQIKNSYIFHISAQNIDCGYSLETPRRGGSNEYPQSMFWAEIRKIMYTPVNPSFTI